MPQPFAVHISVAKRFTVGNVYCRAASFFCANIISIFVAICSIKCISEASTTRKDSSPRYCHRLCSISFVILCSVSFRFVLTFFSGSFFLLASLCHSLFISIFFFVLFVVSTSTVFSSTHTAKRIRCMLLFLNSIHLSKHWTFSESYRYTFKHVRTYGKRVTKITSKETKSER